MIDASHSLKTYTGENQHKDNKTKALNNNVLEDFGRAIDAEMQAEPESLKNILQGLRVSPTDKLQPPQTAWIQENNNGSAILGTLGNFSMIIGKAKSRKSFFINIAVSTILQNDLFLGQFKGVLPQDKCKVLYFDTEQGKYHVQLALRRICDQIQIPAPNDLEVYGLRSKTPSERLQLIEYAIYNTENLGFVIIDGIKDLINSINDESEATAIASKLLKWTEEKQIHILNVLHQNKSDNNARGHIGTELINKAETVLSVTKNEQDKNISIVEAQMCRNREPEPFAFEINDLGLPVLVENFEIRTETNKNKVDVTDLPNYEVFQLLIIVFSKGESFSYSELVRQMKLAFKKKYKKTIGDNRIKGLITYCKNNEWLLQEKDKAPYTQGQFNENSNQ
ncbi:AAA family ATPase [Bizionia paragorgiae]|uniref:AAA family ATPase n=1 Tax=Bizionia paragorgiae TaxID=283786 RepID=UPI003A93BF19